MSISSNRQEMKISSSLNDKEKEEINVFFKKLKFQSHYNNPIWAEWVEPYKKPIFIRFYENTELSGFVIVYVRMAFAVIKFGPLVINKERIPDCINQIIEYLHREKSGLLTVHLPFTNDFDFDSLCLNEKKINYPFSFGKKGWSTILIPLTDKTSEDIFKAFSKGHKSSIKKAIKEGVEARLIDDKKHIDQLSEIYDNMHQRKGLVMPLPDSKNTFNKIFDLNLGGFIGVFIDNEIAGGIVFLSEGNSLLYKFGATNIKYHNMPVLHIAIYEMLKHAIKTNHEAADLGGYSDNAKPGSYSDGVNLFKKGFGGQKVEYSRPLSIRINFVKWLFLSAAFYLNQKIPLPVKNWIYRYKGK